STHEEGMTQAKASAAQLKLFSSVERRAPAAAKAPTKNGHLDVELFAGAGGFSLGLTAAGLPPDLLFEVNSHCCATLRQNASVTSRHFFGTSRQEDVAHVRWSELKQPVRLLSGGPPCQPFSFGGKHLSDRDTRNQFPATLRAVRELRPAAVLLENVPGLARSA